MILSRVLKWLPLGLAVFLVVCGGLAVATAPMGHDDDLAAQGRLAVGKLAEADVAEKDFAVAYDKALGDASVVTPPRVLGDELGMHALLTAIIVNRNADGLLATHKVPANAQLAKFAASVRADGVPGVTGDVAISNFTPVLTRISATDYTWFVTVDVSGEGGASTMLTLSLTADSGGVYTGAEAHWVDSFQRS